MSWLKAFVDIWMESRNGVEGATRGFSRKVSRRQSRRMVLRPRVAA